MRQVEEVFKHRIVIELDFLLNWWLKEYIFISNAARHDEASWTFLLDAHWLFLGLALLDLFAKVCMSRIRNTFLELLT